MQDFLFSTNLIKSAQISSKFAQLLPKSNQICSYLINFASKNSLGDEATYVA